MRTVNKNDVCDSFIAELASIDRYISKCKEVFGDEKLYLSYSYENAIIMTYKAFEQYALRTMIACLNHSHAHFEEEYSIKLGKHINDDVCEFLITNGGFFDFKGRSGLTQKLNKVIGKDNPTAKVFKKDEHKPLIDKLCAIRNYAAHNSTQSKKSAMNVYDLHRISSAGSCLKQQNRFKEIIDGLIALANDVKATPIQ